MALEVPRIIVRFINISRLHLRERERERAGEAPGPFLDNSVSGCDPEKEVLVQESQRGPECYLRGEEGGSVPEKCQDGFSWSRMGRGWPGDEEGGLCCCGLSLLTAVRQAESSKVSYNVSNIFPSTSEVCVSWYKIKVKHQQTK